MLIEVTSKRVKNKMGGQQTLKFSDPKIWNPILKPNLTLTPTLYPKHNLKPKYNPNGNN